MVMVYKFFRPFIDHHQMLLTNVIFKGFGLSSVKAIEFNKKHLKKAEVFFITLQKLRKRIVGLN